MKIIPILVSLSACLLVQGVSAFEVETIRYTHSTNSMNDVSMDFKGKVFKPSLDVLNPKGVVRDAEYKRFQEFFKKLYERNTQGTESAIISVWHPHDHNEIRKAMDKPSLEKNKATFNAMTSMKINMIIHFGSYYICFVETVMPGQSPSVLKFPVTEYQGELVLTNGLNGDYFYELISHYLDETNFRPLLEQKTP